MKIFAISDLHLSFANPKPMGKFGVNWQNHNIKIREYWSDIVDESDVVLIPGDISWALKYEDTIPDLNFIADLPGRKVFVKGNHDYWWSSIKKLRNAAPENMDFIQNDTIEIEDIIVSGTRLWNYPFIKWDCATGFYVKNVKMNNLNGKETQYNHEKIRNRELDRLKLCLSKMLNSVGRLRIFMTHFPPISSTFESNEITRLISENKIDVCVFGHLHGLPVSILADQVVDEVRYVLVSCDYLDFKLKLIHEI